MRSFARIVIVLVTTLGSIYGINNRPLIGLLSQDSYTKVGQSYIVASYVKYLESAGARVVPVLTHQSNDYYERIVNQTDGLLFPGGGQDLHTSGFAKAGQVIWNYTMSGRLNRTYPIWGTCLGFELLLTLVDPEHNLDECSAIDVSNTLTFTPKRANSRLFQRADHNLINILSTENVTYNYHKKCLLNTNRTQKFDQFFDVLSTTKDKNGLEYISTVEAKNHHVYAVQWHPEKNRFEFADNKHNSHIPHSTNAVLISQYMANFFVDQVRQISTRQVITPMDEHKLLIYNYNPVYTGIKSNYEYEQVYFFNTTHTNY